MLNLILFEGYIFDGFPRTIPQAEALDEFLTEKQEAVSQLIALDVDDDEIVKRILQRGKTSGRADDNDEPTIRKRIQVYNDETAVVYGHYEAKDKSKKISGLGSIEEITARLCEKIDSIC